MPDYSYADIAKMIDHSMLKPATLEQQLEDGCRLAVSYDTASVCLMPFYLKRCAEILAGSEVVPCTVIGFPHGTNVTAVKAAEAERALADGGRELDMVINLAKVISGDWDYVKRDIAAVIEPAHAAGAKVKVIFETCSLTDDQKIRLCEICAELKADWVKTSTGYGSHGATVEDVKLMRQHSPAGVQVKASGGIRDLDTLLAMRDAGAHRIGTSSTQAILDDLKQRLG